MTTFVLLLLLLIGMVGFATAQFGPSGGAPPTLSFAIQPPPPPAGPGANFGRFAEPKPVELGNRRFAHRAVIINSENEALLPPQFQNPFYKNARVAEALAKESWFIPGEQQVTDREAEKIPRQKIYAILKNAGLINRRRRRRSTFFY